MENPCNNGGATPAHSDKITVTGNIPPEFLAILEKHRKEHANVQETQVNFTGDKWTPGLCEGLEDIFALSQEKEHARREQKVGERRHPDCNFKKLDPKPIDWNAPAKSMGFKDHPFASPTAVIPRVFRFTVETDLDSNFQYYVQDVDMDFTNKQLKMTLYETKDFAVDDVLEAYNSHKTSQPMTIVLYNGCGVKIMAYRFHGVALHTYAAKLDYSSSDALSPKAVFKYDRRETLKQPTK